MPIEMSGTENLDKRKDVSLSFSKVNDNVAAFGAIGVVGYKDATNFPKHTPPTFNSASATLGVGTETGHSASLTGAHIPSFGNQVTSAVNVNVLKTENHKVDVNAFTTKNFPSRPGPTFHTRGGGVQYQYKEANYHLVITDYRNPWTYKSVAGLSDRSRLCSWKSLCRICPEIPLATVDSTEVSCVAGNVGATDACKILNIQLT